METNAWGDAPPCDCPAVVRRAIWRRALVLRAVPRGQREGWESYPVTGAVLTVLHFLLWDCPRWTGTLAPSARAIAAATGLGQRTVERATAVLAWHGLVVKHQRPRTVPKPVLVAGRVHVIRVRMFASNAFSFPQPGASVRHRQRGGVSVFDGLVPNNQKAQERDAGGRYRPAAVREWEERIRAQRAREAVSGVPVVRPAMVGAVDLLTARRKAVAAAIMRGRQG